MPLSLFLLYQVMIEFVMYISLCGLYDGLDQVYVVLANNEGKDWQVEYSIIKV